MRETDTYSAALQLVVLNPVFGVIWLILVCPTVVIGIVLTPVVIGVPILTLARLLLHSAAVVELTRAQVLLGLDLPIPTAPVIPRGLRQQFRAVLADRTGRRTLLYLLVLGPFGVVGLSTLWLWMLSAFAAVIYPVWYWRGLGGASLQFGSVRITSTPAVTATALCGLALVIAGPRLIRAVAHLDQWVIDRLLGPPHTSLAARIEMLEASRARTVDQAAAERRRIERDLHDGAQARLVRLAMDLGMARQRVEAGRNGTEAVSAIVAAHEEAKRALAELRDLARGIHPAILTDRGLGAALSSLVARSSIPVEIQIEVPGRLSPAAESIAYFVVAEALTNVAKHSQASHATVIVRADSRALSVEVRDDGVGGAALSKGTGLAGLEERLQGVDGVLTISSPPGGPTVVRMELPCAW